MTPSIAGLLLLSRGSFFAAAMATFGMALFPLYAPARSSDLGLDRAMRFAALATLLSAVSWFCLMVADETEAPAAFIETARLVLAETVYGRAWAARLVACLLLVLAAMSARARPVQAALAAIVLATEPWQGHMVERGPLLQAAHVVHLIAAGAWLGGLLPLAVAVRRATHIPSGQAECARLLVRFSIIGMICVGLVAATGVCNTLTIVGPHADFREPYDRLLAIKVAFFAAMLAVAAMNRFQLTPLALKADPAAFRRLRWTILVEQVLAVGVLIVVADLGMTDPAAMMD